MSQSKPPVLMIIPPSLFLLDERVFLSLGILRVAASLEGAGHRIEMVDLSGIQNYEEAVADAARQTESAVACLTATTPQLPAAVKIAAAIRRVAPHLRLIIGGPHVTLVHAAMKLEKKAARIGRAHRALEKLQQTFDVLVSGDGENAIFEALRMQSGIVDADQPSGLLFLTNKTYNETRWPARHLVDMSSYKYSIEGHRATSLVGQLGCPFMCSFSITGDTLVFTDRGFERVDSMAVGAHEVEKCVHGGSVHSFRVDRRVTTAHGSALATTVVHEGTRPVFEVRTENGMRVRGTEEHPFLAIINGEPTWREIRDLRVGDWLVIKSPQEASPEEYIQLQAPQFPGIPPGGFHRKHCVLPTELTEDVGWLAGFLIGDGCLPADGRSSVHLCITDSNRDKIRDIVKRTFDVDITDDKCSLTENMTHGWIHRRAVYEFFVQSLGINPTAKHHVPALIAKSPKSVIRAFLDGLWEADGYDEPGGGSYLTTVSHDLAREVSLLILMLGDVPNIQEVHARGYSSGICYRVSRYRNDRIPTEKALYQSKKSGEWHWRTPRDRRHFLGVRRATLEKSGLPHPLNQPGWHFVRVESITPGLVEEIYDLRVPGDHCFVANGIVSHNCGGRNTAMLRRIRTRDSDNVVAEIEALHCEYGFTGFNFFDDELNVNKGMVDLMRKIRALQDRLGIEFRLRGFVKSELFTAEQAEAMYSAGFRWILCGFEAAHPRILTNIQKKATVEDNDRVVEISHKYGLKVKALMSVGHAGESEETIFAVRDWLISRAPDDFDCTVISTYPGTPYYDEAVPHATEPDVWTYTSPKTGDRLHSYDIDYGTIADYYKGDPDGGYKSYVFTDHISRERIVECRDQVENEVRANLGIKFNPGAPGVRYDHSMGQGKLPEFILRRSA